MAIETLYSLTEFPEPPILSPEQDKERFGVVSEFLTNEYLAGYFKRSDAPSPEVGKKSVVTLNKVLWAMLAEDGYVDRDQVYITSSVAKCIAVGVPEDFWKFDRHVDPDIDFRVVMKPGYTFQDIPKILANKLSQKMVYEKIENGVSFNYRGFNVKICGGFIIPSNYERQLLQIGIFDNNGKRIIHADIAESTQNGSLELKDKRAGLTSLWQDKVVAKAYALGDGEIMYMMDKNIVKLMLEQAAITSLSDNPSDLLEVALRDLRWVLLSLNSPLGMNNSLDKFVSLGYRNFMPAYNTKTFIEFRSRVIKTCIEGKKISPEVLPLLKDELALCLQIDPYLTVQFLRDSGIAMLIPGLRVITYDQWTSVMFSDEFTCAQEIGTIQITPPEKRTISWIKRQHDAYRGRLSNFRLLDGRQRFMRAINENCKGLEESAYDAIWNDGQHSKDAQRFQVTLGNMTLHIPLEDKDLYDKDPRAYLLKQLESNTEKPFSPYAERILKRANKISSDRARILQKLDRHTPYEPLQDVLQAGEMDILPSSIAQIALMLETLDSFQIGVTENELYEAWSQKLKLNGYNEPTLMDKNITFNTLKLLGFVMKNFEGVFTVDEYYIPRYVARIDDLTPKISDLFDTVIIPINGKVTARLIEKYTKDFVPEKIEEIIFNFVEMGIVNLSALQALSKTDLKLLNIEHRMTTHVIVEYLWKMAFYAQPKLANQESYRWDP